MTTVILVVTVAVAPFALLRVASLVHGIHYLFSRKAAEANRIARDPAKATLSWKAIEREAGHERLFGRFLDRLRPPILRSAINTAWRGWVFVLGSAASVVVLTPFARSSSIAATALLVVAFCAWSTSFLLVSHELLKQLRFGKESYRHWSNTVPTKFKDWGQNTDYKPALIATTVAYVCMYTTTTTLLYSLSRATPDAIANSAGRSIDILDATGVAFGQGDVSITSVVAKIVVRLSQATVVLGVGTLVSAATAEKRDP